jgi:xanthine/CO dehydrogenase XdhC/CoxF family maturation factor
MTDLEHILPLWTELKTSGADYVLATVVAVEGSSYRKPGARMLLAQDGRRAGTVSGGCLEAEVTRRAWWLTADGPVVERYSTLEDDGDLPYGSGCGGVVYILLERSKTASPLLHALKACFDRRMPLAIATILEGPRIGERAFAGLPAVAGLLHHSDEMLFAPERSAAPSLQRLAEDAFHNRKSMDATIGSQHGSVRAWADYRSARPGLWIFGAGDDARPLVRIARELGWFVAVADGRSHLATRDRFPAADEVHAFNIGALPGAPWDQIAILPTDAAILITHSFEQDAHVLASLLGESLDFRLAYVGVLGPQRRTREALAEAARLLDLAPTADRVEGWLAQIYAPIGIDLGADTPASIALSILAEIQQTLNAATALPLRQVRAHGVPVPQE